MSDRDEQQEVFYEEEEVLWAKIRGYPWWPAFVDKIHAPARGKETEYTVFFFGDNTQYASSKLGASKLRKFYENYTEFYQKARAHRKLMASIQMAEEKLRQNDQNVEIFEELRSTLKVVKKTKNNPIERKQSKISQPDPEISAGKDSLPDLNKSKTVAHTRAKRNLASREEEEQELHSENESHKNRPKRQEPANFSSEKKSKKQQPKKEEISPPAKRKRNSKQEIFEEESQPKESQKHLPIKIEKEASPMVEEPQHEEPEQSQSEAAEESIEEQQAREESFEDVVYEKKLRNSVKRKSESLRGSFAGPRKRGRPKKKFLRHFTHEEKSESVNRPPPHRFSHMKRKIIHKVKVSPKKAEATSPALSEEDSLIIEQIRQLVHKREQLIDYMGNISITISNVQQILELGVSNILQEGEKSPKVTEILLILRNVLLYKYFPDDVKHKKKYEKILKKKPITIKNDEKEKEDSEEIREEQEIRKKTVVKLEKFLKSHPDIDTKAKELAVRIEAYFQKADSGIGEKYKSIAFKVLSNLKEQKESFSEVIKKLDQHAYD